MDNSTASTAMNILPGSPSPVWVPTAPPDTIPMNQYRYHVNKKFGLDLKDSKELHRWSVTAPQEFWVDLWSYIKLIPDLPPGTTQAYDSTIPMTDVPKFFENARINYAENVLTQPDVSPDAPSLIGIREGQSLDGEVWTWAEFRETVRKIRSALKRSGVKEGDRVAALISTSTWSIAIFLATASLGAIYTSVASDFGAELVGPVVLFADSHSTYKGRRRSNLEKISSIVDRLSVKPEVVVIPLGDTAGSQYLELDQFLGRSATSDNLEFLRVSFSAPLYILYSSGTSGPPKCLVHQHGVILQHRKISKLHNSLRPGEVVFQYSSTSWVLWNIMVGHLSTGATLVMYDGSPAYPTPKIFLDVVQRHNVNYWGVSPGYLQQLEATGVVPTKEYKIPSLRMVQTGGSHLAASQYHWFYNVFPPSIHLTSVTGGTDIVTSWIGTDPAGPLYAGELQMPILGMDIDVADPATGESIRDAGLAGEFICRQPFPSMPVFMWGDKDNKLYKTTYFERFDFPCWAQHDWISFNPATGGSQVHGRSDGVLNPQGVRFGSSEIYSITEAHPLNGPIETTLCIGRRRQGKDADESVFLFVVMRDGHVLDDALESRLREAIRSGLSPRHVPRFVVAVKEIPMTVNGKKVETLVKEVINTGKFPARISTTVANRDCLHDFKKFYHVEVEEAPIRAKL